MIPGPRQDIVVEASRTSAIELLGSPMRTKVRAEVKAKVKARMRKARAIRATAKRTGLASRNEVMVNARSLNTRTCIRRKSTGHMLSSHRLLQSRQVVKETEGQKTAESPNENVVCKYVRNKNLGRCPDKKCPYEHIIKKWE